MGRHRITPENDEVSARICDLWRHGYKVEDIAEMVGLSTSGTRNRIFGMQQEGILRKRKRGPRRKTFKVAARFPPPPPPEDDGEGRALERLRAQTDAVRPV